MHHWDARIGVFAAEVLIALIALGLYGALPGWEAVIPGWLVAGAWLTGTLLTFFGWYSRRRLPRFRESEIGIFVSLNAGGSASDAQKANRVLGRLAQAIGEQADTLGHLQDAPVVLVQRLRSDIRLNTRAERQALTNKTGATYLISAAATHGQLAGREVLAFDRIQTTVAYARLAEPAASIFHAELGLVEQLSIPGRIRMDNDVLDISFVARNVATVASYQIGLALFTRRRWTHSATFLRKAIDGAPRSPLARTARRFATEATIAPYLLDFPDPASSESWVQEAISAVETARKLDPHCHLVHALDVSCRFLAGDLAGANDALRELRRTAPKPMKVMCELDRAVFFLDAGKAKAARSTYARVARLAIPPDVLSSALKWLSAAAVHRSKIYWLGYAILQDDHGDPRLAHDAYRRVRGTVLDDSDTIAFVSKRISDLSPAPVTPLASEIVGSAAGVAVKAAAPTHTLL